MQAHETPINSELPIHNSIVPCNCIRHCTALFERIYKQYFGVEGKLTNALNMRALELKRDIFFVDIDVDRSKIYLAGKAQTRHIYHT